MREVEQEPGQIGGEDFGRGGQRERCDFPFLPQPIADARRGAAGAPAPLVGRSARDAHGVEAGEAEIGLIARDAGKACVDHNAHALDGERCLGD
jgi:hypothetical protein